MVGLVSCYINLNRWLLAPSVIRKEGMSPCWNIKEVNGHHAVMLLRIPTAVKCFPLTVDIERAPKISCIAIVDFKFEAAFAPIQNSLNSGQDVFRPASNLHTKKSCGRREKENIECA